MNKKIESKNAPAAIGPYSQAICTGDMIFISGQLGLDHKTGDFPASDIVAQTTQSLENIKAILEEAGFSFKDVVKTTVMLSDIKDFVAMNEIYARYFVEPFPARCAYQVAALPKGGKVEIEVIAKK
ncbi:MAG: RidA family protein [Lachnospiraceae bacterium]|nr:RidA family protein [Lachnospiraceae bacterium]